MKNEEVIIQTSDVKVRVIELEPGQSGPFHFHSEITDTMFGISGEIIVSLRNPPEEIILKPGVQCTILPGRVHQVTNTKASESSKYLLIQGVGQYDFIKEDA